MKPSAKTGLGVKSLDIVQRVEASGFSIVHDLLSQSEIVELTSDLASQAPQSLRGGVRNLMAKVAAARRLAYSAKMISLATAILGEEPFPVRSILFDKTESSNWKVPWHQDVTIAVKGQFEVEDYGPWSIKADVMHVQPPTEVLLNMISIRIHLDDCPASNGALKVIPGSHTKGKISETEAAKYVAATEPVICEASAGSALIMRPLLMHSSSASIKPGHRRVIHIDYASFQLPDPLQWHES